MKENQQIEWKESWRDEHLKLVCGFANAEGGVLVIGRNDRGEPVGVRDPACRWPIASLLRCNGSATRRRAVAGWIKPCSPMVTPPCRVPC